MAKYEICYAYTVSGTVVVEADSEDEARDKFTVMEEEDLLAGGDDTDREIVEIMKVKK